MTCALTQLVPADNTDEWLIKVTDVQSMPSGVMICSSDNDSGVESVEVCGFRVKSDYI